MDTKYRFDEMLEDGVTLSKPLTSEDKRIFMACVDLKVHGHDTITTEQIYAAMGNTDKLGADERKHILRRIEVMSVCCVVIVNPKETMLQGQYRRVTRQFYLLPTVVDCMRKNGVIVEDAVTILEIPRLYTMTKNKFN